MEINEKIKGYSLNEINKNGEIVKMKFSSPSGEKGLQLKFEGLLFETPSLMLNREVTRLELTHVLGFKSMTQLRHQGKNPSEYKQLLIQLDGSTSEYKNELICAFKHYDIKPIASRVKQH